MAKKDKVKKPSLAPEGGWPTNRKTVPATASEPESTEKRPAVLDLDHDQIQARRLVWRFAEVDKHGDWAPASISMEAMGDLLDKMASYESMTIGEIFKPGSQHGKSYAVESLPRDSRKRLEAIERDDETEVSRLRCGGAPRLYGFLREHVFHVLWWDPKHEVFPSTKRNT